MPFLWRPDFTLNRGGVGEAFWVPSTDHLGTVAESLGTEAGPPALRQDGISALQLPGTPAAVPSAESHLLIAPPRCLQQRTDYSDGGEIEYGPLLAVTTQNNLSCAADCLHLASACKRARRWRRVQEKAGGLGPHRRV